MDRSAGRRHHCTEYRIRSCFALEDSTAQHAALGRDMGQRTARQRISGLMTPDSGQGEPHQQWVWITRWDREQGTALACPCLVCILWPGYAFAVLARARRHAAVVAGRVHGACNERRCARSRTKLSWVRAKTRVNHRLIFDEIELANAVPSNQQRTCSSHV